MTTRFVQMLLDDMERLARRAAEARADQIIAEDDPLLAMELGIIITPREGDADGHAHR